MTARCYRIMRKAAPLGGAGMLLQTGGCTFDATQLAEGLFTAIANNLITSLVFGLFNVPVGGGL